MFKTKELVNGVKYSSTDHKFQVDDLFKIYQFTDVSCFEPHPKNRKLNQKHIKTIAKAFLEGNWIPPVEVNINTGYVIDHHHILEAWKMAMGMGYTEPLNVIFLNIAPEKELMYIIVRNNNSRNWELNDYVYAFREKGNAYDKIIKICEDEKYPLLYKVMSDGTKKIQPRYFGDMIFGKQPDSIFKSGNLDEKLTQYLIDKGLKVNSEIERIAVNLGRKYKGNVLEALIIGWCKAKEEISSKFHNWLKYYTIDSAIDCMTGDFYCKDESKIFIDGSEVANYEEWKNRFIGFFSNLVNYKKFNK